MKRPNILIVMTDHQRADTVAAEHPALTPTIERLGREGVTFANAHCPSPHCCPCRATFFSGLYPSRHGIWNNVLNPQALRTGLLPGVRLWSEDLAHAGYRMDYIGKWHVSREESPANRGWHEHEISAAVAYGGNRWKEYRRSAGEGRREGRSPGEIVRPGYPQYHLYGLLAEGEVTHDDRVATTAVSVLGELVKSETPWCLYVGFIGPHDPYRVPERFLNQYDLKDVPLPSSYSDDLRDKPRIYRRMRERVFGQLGREETRDAIRHFWAYCSYLDDLFGRILRVLDASDQAEDTLVLYCSDHGDYCGEHGLFCKGVPCFRGAYHIPAVARWPSVTRDSGRQVDELVSLADFGPTFQEAVGLEVDQSLTGRSLMPFLRGDSLGEWRDAIYTQCNGVELYFTQRSVTTGDFKYVYNGFDRDELYDLRADPHEMRNLADQSEYEPVVRDLCGRMWRFAEAEGDTANSSYITVGLVPFGPAEAY